jgi:hypothetical protein
VSKENVGPLPTPPATSSKRSIPELAPDDSNRRPNLVDKWGNQALIGFTTDPGKPLTNDRPTQVQGPSNGMFGGRALPGMTARSPASPPPLPQESVLGVFTGRRAPPDLTTPAPQSFDKEDKSPVSPVRHSRIPSTGNRATVMDVAHALNDPEHVLEVVASSSQPPMMTQPKHIPPFEDNVATSNDQAVSIPPARHTMPPGVQSERRKSNYERYSAVMLPPLLEENTPAPSPAATLSRTTDLATDLGKPLTGVSADEAPRGGSNAASHGASKLEMPTPDDVVRFSE